MQPEQNLNTINQSIPARIQGERLTNIKAKMETKFYIMTKIDGEYATLKEQFCGDELFIAMALLPLGVDIGTVLKYENMEFEII